MRFTPRKAAMTAALTLGAAAAAVVPAQATPVVGHWADRTLVIEDQTGDASWQRAVEDAVDSWNAAGSDLRLEFRTGPAGACSAGNGTVAVCVRDLGRRRYQGVTRIGRAQGHIVDARVTFDDRPFTDVQKTSLACHEIGHAIGLHHSRSASSCLTSRGYPAKPHADDLASLVQAYAHGH